jgi:hypothetical protein
MTTAVLTSAGAAASVHAKARKHVSKLLLFLLLLLLFVLLLLLLLPPAAFKEVADPIINFLSSLLSFIPDIKCPPELSFICNIDELIFDLLTKVSAEYGLLLAAWYSITQNEVCPVHHHKQAASCTDGVKLAPAVPTPA